MPLDGQHLARKIMDTGGVQLYLCEKQVKRETENTITSLGVREERFRLKV